MRFTPAAMSLTLVTLAACASSVGVAESFPTGRYEVAILPNEVPARSDIQGVPGSWVIEFGRDAEFEARRDDQLIVRGTFKASDRSIILTELSGTFGCADASGRYAWSASGAELVLSDFGDGLESDACPTRRLVLTLKPLTRILG
jgi:hypothetical protein